MKLPIQLLVTLILLGISFGEILAQNEGNIWYFGYQAGLDFNSSPVRVDSSNNTSFAYGGSSSISNPKGQLLFYSNGENVWDKTGSVMKNGSGLNGNHRSGQSSLIVPQPEDTSKYFLFTNSDLGKDGVYYSRIDTSGNGGNGIVFLKNTQILSKASEGLAAVKHANGVDYWIVAHEYGNNKFYVWKLSKKGISKPVVSSIGVSHSSSDPNYALGCITFSSDGRQMAATNVESTVCQLFKFDMASGVLSNPVTLNTPFGSYGVEYSPSGNILYVGSASKQNSKFFVSQYDVESWDSARISNSRITVGQSKVLFPGTLQTAPNGKIYFSAPEHIYNNCHYISEIQQPDSLGTKCKFVDSSIYLGGWGSKTKGVATLGLPNLPESFYYKPTVEHNTICLGDSSQFVLNGLNSPDSIWWYINSNDSLKTTNDTLWYIATQAGEINLRLKAYKNKVVTNYKHLFRVYETPVFTLGNDTAICPDSKVNLAFTGGDFQYTYKWSDQSTSPSLSTNDSGLYWLEVNNGVCSKRDSVRIFYRPIPKIVLPNDTLVCSYDTVHLAAPISADSILWSNGSTSYSSRFSRPGNHWLIAGIQGCFNEKLFGIRHSIAPVVQLPADTAFCAFDSLELSPRNSVSTIESYQWNTSDVDSTITIRLPGTYWLKVTDSLCHGSDTIIVSEEARPNLGLDDTTFICKDDSLLISYQFPNAEYSWSDGSTEGVRYFHPGTKYYVRVETNVCTETDSTQTIAREAPSIDIGKDTLVCEMEVLTTKVQNKPDLTYRWGTGDTSETIQIVQEGTYVLMVEDNGHKPCVVWDTIDVKFEAKPHLNLGNDTTICPNSGFELDAILPNSYSYSWQDGSKNSKITVTPTINQYWVRASNGICTLSDTIEVLTKSEMQFKLGSDTTFCGYDSLTLEINEAKAESFKWFDEQGDLLSTDRKYNFKDDSILLITEAFDGLCYKSDSIVVQRVSDPNITLSPDTILCDGATLFVDKSSVLADTYTWSSGSTLASQTFDEAGLYWLEVSIKKCKFRDSTRIETLGHPELSFGTSDTILCDAQDELFYSFTIPQTTFLWSGGSTASSKSINTDGNYWVQASNFCGTSSDTISVEYDVFGCQVYLPNAFTPNGDGINDKFGPVTPLPSGNLLDFSISGSTGQLLYKKEGYGQWDGRFMNKNCQLDTYVWDLRYSKMVDGRLKIFIESGVVNLLR